MLDPFDLWHSLDPKGHPPASADRSAFFAAISTVTEQLDTVKKNALSSHNLCEEVNAGFHERGSYSSTAETDRRDKKVGERGEERRSN